MAEADLAEIWDHVASDAGVATATRLVELIAAAFEPLRRLPLAGPARQHLAPGLRVVFRGAYAVYYTSLADAVVIVRVLHGARDVTALADRDGFA